MNNYTILIVDDVAKNIQIAAQILQTEGYEIRFAKSGKAAIDLLKTKSIDLILLDIMMPELDGYEVCKMIQDNPKTSNIPIIFITAKTDAESISQGFEFGAVDYITKPFNSLELLARVKNQLKIKLVEKELREALSAKNKFFSIIAHDLKNPFSGFLGLSQMMSQEFDKIRPEDLKEYSKAIFTSATSLYKLLEDLLQWSRTQLGTIPYEPEQLDIYELAFNNLFTLEKNIFEKKITVFNNIRPNTIAFCDRNMITTVIRNLVTNAIKFTHPGGKITLSYKLIEIKSKDFIEVSIKDTGVGISEETIEKLLDISAHYTSLGTNKEKGTGLGLILCKEFIEKHGGSLKIYSSLGEGSIFSFTIPAAKKEVDF